MQITELLSLRQWYEEKIVKEGILEAYDHLAKAVLSNVNSSTSKPFTDERETVFNELSHINCNELTLEQVSLLEQMGVLPLLGTQGQNTIDSLFGDGLLDIAAVSNKLTEFFKTLEDGRTYLTNTASYLEHFFQVEKDSEIAEDETLIRIYFKDQAAIDNLSDFKERGNDWYQIGRGIALATGIAPEDIKIIGAEKGSIIIDVVTIAGVACIISKVVLEVLKATQRILDIRKTLLEIENLKLQNVKIAQEIQEEMDKEEKTLVDGVLEILGNEEGINFTDGERKDALKKSITLLMKFTKGGGKLDFIHNNVPENDDEDGEENVDRIANLRKSMTEIDENTTEIRAIEERLALLTEKVL